MKHIFKRARLTLIIGGAFLATATLGATAQTCAERVQGKLAWNQAGNMEWVNNNIETLCQDATNVDDRIICFADGIAKHNSWETALADCTAPLNGETTSKVYFSQGSFTENGSGWTEYGLDGEARFTFEERTRDEWSVYLYDPSRDVHLQLDLWRKKISYATGSDPRSDLYDVIAAQ